MAALVSREAAFCAARAEADRALREVAADYAAGRLSPDRAAAYERLLELDAERRAAALPAAA